MNPLIPSAKTIQIYLPTGNPRGLRVAEMTTRTVRLIEVPRIHIADFLSMPDAKQVGLYFLIGDTDSTDKPLLYIGQTGDLTQRLKSHHNGKDFWTRVFVMLSTNNTITQTHALYMEHKAIQIATDVGRYDLQNGNNGSKPHTPAPLQADCEELFHTLDILLSTLGQPVFEAIGIETPNNKAYQPLISDTCQSPQDTPAVVPDKQPMLFYCKAKDCDAQGYYDNDGFVLLKGSLFRKRHTPSLGKWAVNKTSELLVNGKLVEHNNDSYRLTEDQLFKTPSGAAQAVTGRPTNGWVEWKNKAGQTLSDIYR
uniref:GIY-YIG nuclease family protein n=1 Tax=uncultured Psychrobacter sp. TaxID=259303 RepID=UPI002592BC7E|nr:GIY-YIG nuclease family protein [uncultured Psychrobacter sp.]